MELTIHNDIMDRLHHFHKVGKIPNIIFHGNYACGKKYLLYNFIDLIYKFRPIPPQIGEHHRLDFGWKFPPNTPLISKTKCQFCASI